MFIPFCILGEDNSQMFIASRMAPEYLRHLVPPTIQSTTIYPLRNGDNLIVPFCRLSITNSSFIPSTVKEWNKLDIAIRKLDSLSKFKNAIRLNSQSNKISVPKLYYYGPRKLNVILTQIRCTASFLNHDLHKGELDDASIQVPFHILY
jgi:hypothetical protein